MATRLIVKNFGPIRDVEIELTKNMVFIGPQSSGKSTLAKLIATCIDMEMDRSRGSAYFSGALIFYNMQSYFKKDTYIRFVFGDGKEFICSYSKDYPPDGNGIERANIVMYIPSERSIYPILNNSIMGLSYRNISIPKNILFFGNELEMARKRGVVTIPMFGVKYIPESGRDKLLLKDGSTIELSEASSGFQSAIPLFVVLENTQDRKYHSVVVEEPEQNLYPESQKDIAYYLAGQSSYLKKLFCITTHSPYILTSLNNCLLAYESGLKNKTETHKIIPESQWLNPKYFSAYYIDKGEKRTIFKKEEGLINEEYLDEASNSILKDHGQLLDIIYYDGQDD